MTMDHPGKEYFISNPIDGLNSSPCIYPCANYSEENLIPSISLDLYGLSVTPPPSSTPSNLNENPPIINKQEESTSPVIYPWMRKVHINNPG